MSTNLSDALRKFGIDPARILTDMQTVTNEVASLFATATAKPKLTKEQRLERVQLLEALVKVASEDATAQAIVKRFTDAIWQLCADVTTSPSAVVLATDVARQVATYLSTERDDQLPSNVRQPVRNVSRADCVALKNILVGLSNFGAELPDKFFVEHRLPRKDDDKVGGRKVTARHHVYIWQGTVLEDGLTLKEVVHDYVSNVSTGQVFTVGDVVKLVNAKYPKGWAAIHWQVNLPTGTLEGMPVSSDSSEEE